MTKIRRTKRKKNKKNEEEKTAGNGSHTRFEGAMVILQVLAPQREMSAVVVSFHHHCGWMKSNVLAVPRL